MTLRPGDINGFDGFFSKVEKAFYYKYALHVHDRRNMPYCEGWGDIFPGTDPSNYSRLYPPTLNIGEGLASINL